MPKGNATKSCFPVVLVQGKMTSGARRLMASERVTTSVVAAVGLLRSQGWVYLEAYGNNLAELERLFAKGDHVAQSTQGDAGAGLVQQAPCSNDAITREDRDGGGDMQTSDLSSSGKADN